jgi:hypothetical protein
MGDHASSLRHRHDSIQNVIALALDVPHLPANAWSGATLAPDAAPCVMMNTRHLLVRTGLGIAQAR